MTVTIDAVRAVRPSGDEYAPFYAGYVARVPDADIVLQLGQQIEALGRMLAEIPESRASHRYAPGKWSIKELVGHLCDAERVFMYRALRVSRNDATPLEGFDENHYVANARYGERTLADVAAEFRSVRGATLTLLDSLSAEQWERRGVANGHPVSVRGLAWITAGHELHHRHVLATRYLAP